MTRIENEIRFNSMLCRSMQVIQCCVSFCSFFSKRIFASEGMHEVYVYRYKELAATDLMVFIFSELARTTLLKLNTTQQNQSLLKDDLNWFYLLFFFPYLVPSGVSTKNIYSLFEYLDVNCYSLFTSFISNSVTSELNSLECWRPYKKDPLKWNIYNNRGDNINGNY